MRFRCAQYDDLGNLYEGREKVYETDSILYAALAFQRQFEEWPTSVVLLADGVAEESMRSEVQKWKDEAARLQAVSDNRRVQVQSLEKKVVRYRVWTDTYRMAYLKLAAHVEKAMVNLTAQRNAVA